MEGQLAQIVDAGVQVKAGSMVSELVRAVVRTGKKGKVTLEIEIAPGGEGEVEITPRLKSSLPVPNMSTSRFFVVGEEGELSRRNPAQMSLDDLKVVSGGAE